MMKNTELIKVVAILGLTVALLYRKYKKKNSGAAAGKKMPDKPMFSSHHADDDYEPYSKKQSSE
jgi:hypothetical protein